MAKTTLGITFFGRYAFAEERPPLLVCTMRPRTANCPEFFTVDVWAGDNIVQLAFVDRTHLAALRDTLREAAEEVGGWVSEFELEEEVTGDGG